MPVMLARYEFKYLIRESDADYIREVVRCYCEPDSYGANGIYSVNSLYCDTLDWKLAQQTIAGIRHRFKLRIRTYGWKDDDVVFLENKGRVGTSIIKERALMKRSLVEPLLKGELPPPAIEPDGFVALKASHQPDLEGFRNLYDAIDARPRLWVRYVREAWGSAYGDGARLTFDRTLQVQDPNDEHPFVPDHSRWTDVPLDPVKRPRRESPFILEMKFNGASPKWMQKIVHALHLDRVSASKYCIGAEHLGALPWNTWEMESAWTG